MGDLREPYEYCTVCRECDKYVQTKVMKEVQEIRVRCRKCGTINNAPKVGLSMTGKGDTDE